MDNCKCKTDGWRYCHHIWFEIYDTKMFSVKNNWSVPHKFMLLFRPLFSVQQHNYVWNVKGLSFWLDNVVFLAGHWPVGSSSLWCQVHPVHSVAVVIHDFWQAKVCDLNLPTCCSIHQQDISWTTQKQNTYFLYSLHDK